MNIPGSITPAIVAVFSITFYSQFLTGCSVLQRSESKTPANKEFKVEKEDPEKYIYFPEIVYTDSFVVDYITIHKSSIPELTAEAISKSDTKIEFCIRIESDPGYWFRRGQTKTFKFELLPGTVTEIKAPYNISIQTPETLLDVVFGTCSVNGSKPAIAKPIHISRQTIGILSPSENALAAFDHYVSEHFEMFVHKNSYLPLPAEQIIEEREKAYEDLSKLLNFDTNLKIRLAFYSDEKKLVAETGQQNIGFATGNTIVEILNRYVKLDPYHELTHVMMNRIGQPPSLFNEGFATYMSEYFGENALKYINRQDEKLDNAACNYMRNQKLVPIYYLFQLNEFESKNSRSSIYYSESGSFIKFLINQFGIEKFKAAYSQLKSPSNAANITFNEEKINKIYDLNIYRIEYLWQQQLCDME